ncbi:MAG: DsbA family protein [Candidatus Nitrosothermus koennekii]|nr:MAG: DsbA family protein [Candidatus Nitrosothermus koennekii]
MANKRFALIAMIVGAIGVIIGGYSIAVVSNTMLTNEENTIEETNIDTNQLIIQGIDVSKGSPLLGDKDAPITIIEFGDYQCPRCDQWYLNQRPILEDKFIDTNNVNLYFLDFPFLGSDSFIAAEATYCAEEQGKYWEYHGILYENQKGIDSGWANKDNLIKFAEELGLDIESFKDCLDTGRYKDRVEYNKSIGLDNGVQGTPTFFIIDNIDNNVVKIVGAQPVEVFEKTINAMLK